MSNDKVSLHYFGSESSFPTNHRECCVCRQQCCHTNFFMGLVSWVAYVFFGFFLSNDERMVIIHHFRVFWENLRGSPSISSGNFMK